MAASRSLGVITYLAQDRHSSYGRDSLSMLKKSVESLFMYYNAVHKDDVIFFHTGLNSSVQQEVLQLCSGSSARFLKLAPHHFQAPPGTPPQSKWKQALQYSAGYRHMIRFYTLGIWDVVRAEGYEYVMRMDEDSLLWSPIRYNLFDFMSARNIAYAYRLAAWEHGFHGFGGDHYFSLPRRVVPPNRTGWLLDSCRSGRRNLGNFTLRHCGEPYGVYNNFFISRVDFWFLPHVQMFLASVEASHLIYTLRFNDILWQSTAIKLFMEPQRVFMFQDWAYEHVTFRSISHGGGRHKRRQSQCAQVGAFVLGTDGARHEPARQRARELLRQEACMIAQSVTRVALTLKRVRRCVIAQPHNRSVLDAITFGGSVSTEQPFCDRTPAPYYCTSDPNARSVNERRPEYMDAWRTRVVCNETARPREGGHPTALIV